MRLLLSRRCHIGRLFPFLCSQSHAPRFSPPPPLPPFPEHVAGRSGGEQQGRLYAGVAVAAGDPRRLQRGARHCAGVFSPLTLPRPGLAGPLPRQH